MSNELCYDQSIRSACLRRHVLKPSLWVYFNVRRHAVHFLVKVIQYIAIVQELKKKNMKKIRFTTV